MVMSNIVGSIGLHELKAVRWNMSVTLNCLPLTALKNPIESYSSVTRGRMTPGWNRQWNTAVKTLPRAFLEKILFDALIPSCGEVPIKSSSALVVVHHNGFSRGGG